MLRRFGHGLARVVVMLYPAHPYAVLREGGIEPLANEVYHLNPERDTIAIGRLTQPPYETDNGKLIVVMEVDP